MNLELQQPRWACGGWLCSVSGTITKDSVDVQTSALVGSHGLKSQPCLGPRLQASSLLGLQCWSWG